MIPYIETNSQITVIVDQKSHSFPLNGMNEDQRKAIISACMKGDARAIMDLVSPQKKVEKVLSKLNNLEVTETGVKFKGSYLANSITNRIATYVEQGYNYSHLLKFLDKLLNNPSFTTQGHLYRFLENKNLPITEDGCFLAYKGVRSDYLDKYSGKFDNTPGQVLTMERSAVDDNAAHDCSYGFHVGSLAYASNWAEKVVVVKVDPSDVVAVTTDHDFQKMRVCKYEVLYDYEKELNPVFESTTTNWDDDWDDDWNDECDDEGCPDCDCLHCECDDEEEDNTMCFDPTNPQVGQENSLGNRVLQVSMSGKVRMSFTGGLWLDPTKIML